MLVETLPHARLISLIKADSALAQTVFRGFAVRESSLTRPVVRQRLEQELTRLPELTRTFFDAWLAVYATLMAQLNAPDFTPSPAVLQPLLKTYGEAALHYALLHADREDLRHWSDRIAELRKPTATKAPPPPTPPHDVSGQVNALRHEIDELRIALGQQQQTMRAAEQAAEAARREVVRLQSSIQKAEDTHRKALIAFEQRVEREQRRVHKAEEQVEALKQQLRDAAKITSPAPMAGTLPTDAMAAVSEAIALLQRSLVLAQSSAPAAKTSPAPPETAPPPSRPVPPPRKPVEGPSITLPAAKGKQTFPLSEIVTALRRNDLAVIDRVRDGVARLPDARSREVLAACAHAGIPATLLSGPLRPCVVDGSNITNMSPERRARLVYLQQVQRSAWEEGYFPVFIVVDASLRHQIDQADALMELVERGEIQMAPPGTSADELLIDEALRHQAVIITNDRLADWPAAKSLEKRHAELHRGTVRIGSFHRAGLWLPW